MRRTAFLAGMAVVGAVVTAHRADWIAAAMLAVIAATCAYLSIRQKAKHTRVEGSATMIDTGHRSTPIRITEEEFAEAAAEIARLTRDLDITNADHIALWLEANMVDSPLGWLACRIVEAHEAALAQVGGHPKGGDALAAPFMTDAVGTKGPDAPLTPSNHTIKGRQG